jgi:hypothetical protein
MSASNAAHAQYAAYAAAAAARAEAARVLAAQRLTSAGNRMRASAWRRLDAAAQPLALGEGDAVRVSLLVLPHVRRLLKSKLVGDPLPLFSTDVFRVARVRPDGTYDVACTSCHDGDDPLPALVNGCLAQLPGELRAVPRRYLMRVPAGATPTMGHAAPAMLPRVWARA